MSLQADNPRPVPPFPLLSGPLLVVKNGSKILGRFSAEIPEPESRTVSTTEFDFASYAIRIRIVPTSPIACLALVSKFNIHHVRNFFELCFNRHSVLLQFAFEQNQRVLD